MSATPALRPGDRVLVTRLNYLGDVVLSLPLVDAIRRAAPGVEVDYLTRRPGAELLHGDARFGEVFRLEGGAAATAALVARLRARHYRAVIDLYSNPRSAWLSLLCGARIRVGGSRRARRWFYTDHARKPASPAVTEVFLAYGEVLGVGGGVSSPALELPDAERVSARAWMGEHGAAPGGARPLIGVHPGGKWSVKRWPAEKFAALVGRLGERLGASFVLFTGPDERDATERVAALCGEGAAVLPAAGVRRVAAAIANLDAMVACDGGIMHVAAAVGTPTVGIFGSSQPEVWFPYGQSGPHRAAFLPVECRPCHRHVCPLGHTRCLNDLEPGVVAAKVEEVLASRGGKS